jgi:hypothetical protein
MTALQWIVKEAKAIKKQYPKRFAKWTDYVAQASAIYAKKHGGKSPVGKKKAVKKKTAKKVVRKKVGSVKASKEIKKVLAKKGLKMPHGYQTIKRKRKIAGVKKSAPKSNYHKDTKSHNVNIRVISGITKNGELKRLTQLVSNSSNKLEKKVASMLKEKVSRGGYDSLRSLIKDVLYNGLQSGIINDLIYYSDTLKFYKAYKKEILALLNETLRNTGYRSADQLFGKNWDDEDPMAQDTQNQNLLAWFGFEEITRNLADQLAYDI